MRTQYYDDRESLWKRYYRDLLEEEEKKGISRQLENEKQADIIIYLPIAATPAKNPALAYKPNARKSIQTYVNARMQNARFN